MRRAPSRSPPHGAGRAAAAASAAASPQATAAGASTEAAPATPNRQSARVQRMLPTSPSASSLPMTPLSSSRPATPSSASGRPRAASSVDRGGYSNMQMLFGDAAWEDERAEDDPDFMPSDEDEEEDDEEEEEEEEEECDGDDADASSIDAASSVPGSTAEGVARRTRAHHSLEQMTFEELELRLPPVDWEEDEARRFQQQLAEESTAAAFGGTFFTSPPVESTTDTSAAQLDDAYHTYNQFKLMLSSDNLDEFDDDDAEFHPTDEPADEDEEEYRNDRSVSISKKELRHLKSDRARNLESTVQPVRPQTRGAMTTRRKEGYIAPKEVPSEHTDARSLALPTTAHDAGIAAGHTQVQTPAPLPAAATRGGERHPTRTTSSIFASGYSSIPSAAQRLQQNVLPVVPLQTTGAPSVPPAASRPDPIDLMQLGGSAHPHEYPAATASLVPMMPSFGSPDVVPSMSPLFDGNELPAMMSAAPPQTGPDSALAPPFPPAALMSLLPFMHMPMMAPMQPLIAPAAPPPPPPRPATVAHWTEPQRARLRLQLCDHLQLLVQVRYLTLNSVLAPLSRPPTKSTKKPSAAHLTADSADEEKHEGKEAKEATNSGAASSLDSAPSSHVPEPLMTLSQIWDRTTDLLDQLVSKRDASVRRWRQHVDLHDHAGTEDPFANPTSSPRDHPPVLAQMPMIDVWRHLSETEERVASHAQMMRAQDRFIPMRFRQHFQEMTRARMCVRPEATDDAGDTSSAGRPWARTSQWCFTPLLFSFLSADTQSLLRTNLRPLIASVTRKVRWTPAEDALLLHGYQLFGRGVRPGKDGLLADWDRLQKRLLPGRTVAEVRKRHSNYKQEMAIRSQPLHTLAPEFMGRDSDDEDDTREMIFGSGEQEQKYDTNVPLMHITPQVMADTNADLQMSLGGSTLRTNIHSSTGLVFSPPAAEAAAASAAPAAPAAAPVIDAPRAVYPPVKVPGIRGVLQRELSEEELSLLHTGLDLFPPTHPTRWKSIAETFLPTWDRLALRRAWVRLEKLRAEEAANSTATAPRRPRRRHQARPEMIAKQAALRQFVAPSPTSALPQSAVPTTSPPNLSAGLPVQPAVAADLIAFDEVDMTLEEAEEEAAAAAATTHNTNGVPEQMAATASATAMPLAAMIVLQPADHGASAVSSGVGLAVSSASMLSAVPPSLLPSSTFSALAASDAPSATPEFELMEDEETDVSDGGVDDVVAATAEPETSAPPDDERDEGQPMQIEDESHSEAVHEPHASFSRPVKSIVDDAHLADVIVALKATDSSASAPSASPLRSHSHAKTPQKAALLHSSFAVLARSSELVETVPPQLLAPVPQQLAYSAEQYAYASAATPNANHASPSKRQARTNSRHATPIVREEEAGEQTSHMRLRYRTPTSVARVASGPAAATPPIHPTPLPTSTSFPPVGPATRPPPRSARVLAETSMQRALLGSSASASANAGWTRINDSLNAATHLTQHLRQTTTTDSRAREAPATAEEQPTKKQRLTETPSMEHAPGATSVAVAARTVRTNGAPAPSTPATLPPSSAPPPAHVFSAAESRTLLLCAKAHGARVDRWPPAALADLLSPKSNSASDPPRPPRTHAAVQSELRRLLTGWAAIKQQRQAAGNESN